MQSNEHLKVVEIPHFITTAKEAQEAKEHAREAQERALHRMLIQAYRVGMVRIILDACVIACAVAVLYVLK